jgi:hypothetical protein
MAAFQEACADVPDTHPPPVRPDQSPPGLPWPPPRAPGRSAAIQTGVKPVVISSDNGNVYKNGGTKVGV